MHPHDLPSAVFCLRRLAPDVISFNTILAQGPVPALIHTAMERRRRVGQVLFDWPDSYASHGPPQWSLFWVMLF